MKIRKELKEEKKQKLVCGDGEKKEEKIVNLSQSFSSDSVFTNLNITQNASSMTGGRSCLID